MDNFIISYRLGCAEGVPLSRIRGVLRRGCVVEGGLGPHSEKKSALADFFNYIISGRVILWGSISKLKATYRKS